MGDMFMPQRPEKMTKEVGGFSPRSTWGKHTISPNTSPKTNILLTEEKLHQLRLVDFSHYLQGFLYISSGAGFLNHQQYPLKMDGWKMKFPLKMVPF